MREKFSSRLGFVLTSAGCAIGLGNVWRFPYIAGKYGGAAFVLLYLFFLIVLGLPIMTMEFSVGRASGASVATSFKKLEPKGTKWHWFSIIGIIGNYLLMMFYTVIAGWMINYFVKMLRGEFVGATTESVKQIFDAMTGDAKSMVLWTMFVIIVGFAVCSLGLKKGVEKITKVMMLLLLAIMGFLAIRSVTLNGAVQGLSFYLKPDLKKIADAGILNVVSAAMGQAFFTLSIGAGSMAIFGSYIGKERSLVGESLSVLTLDTIVAVISGFIVFPACFAFGVNPQSGPDLVFITLPQIFNHMEGGKIWGALFFIFMSFAAMSTVIAVFENIISFWMDLWNWSRKKSVAVNIILMIALSMPCVFGFNLLGDIHPFGGNSTIMDFEEFIVSNNILPLGSLVYLLFCVTRYGWGWDNFMSEVNCGKGLKFPAKLRFYVTYIIPLIILFLFVQGYIEKF